MAEKKHIQHLRSKVVENGKPKLPTSDALMFGEIAVNYGKGVETLSIKNESGDVVTFSSDDVYTKNKLGVLFSGDTTVTNALSGKQDTLISGTNIKTINNASLLGSGNITISGGGSVTVDSELSEDSVNPVQNKVITNALAFKKIVNSATTNVGIVNTLSEYYDTNIGKGAVIEGDGSSVKITASGDYSHAEGVNTIASGNSSHAEGQRTTASGSYSHAEGNTTRASGDSSHAEGWNTKASGDYSHAEGFGTIANNYAEHASGRYNVSSTASTTFGDSGNTLFSVGNGREFNARHNAFEIRQNGDIYIVKDNTDVKLQDALGGGGVVVDINEYKAENKTLPLNDGYIYYDSSLSYGKYINLERISLAYDDEDGHIEGSRGSDNEPFYIFRNNVGQDDESFDVWNCYGEYHGHWDEYGYQGAKSEIYDDEEHPIDVIGYIKEILCENLVSENKDGLMSADDKKTLSSKADSISIADYLPNGAKSGETMPKGAVYHYNGTILHSRNVYINEGDTGGTEGDEEECVIFCYHPDDMLITHGTYYYAFYSQSSNYRYCYTWTYANAPKYIKQAFGEYIDSDTTQVLTFDNPTNDDNGKGVYERVIERLSETPGQVVPVVWYDYSDEFEIFGTDGGWLHGCAYKNFDNQVEVDMYGVGYEDGDRAFAKIVISKSGNTYSYSQYVKDLDTTATSGTSGLMSAEDKIALDSLSGAVSSKADSISIADYLPNGAKSGETMPKGAVYHYNGTILHSRNVYINEGDTGGTEGDEEECVIFCYHPDDMLITHGTYYYAFYSQSSNYRYCYTWTYANAPKYIKQAFGEYIDSDTTQVLTFDNPTNDDNGKGVYERVIERLSETPGQVVPVVWYDYSDEFEIFGTDGGWLHGCAYKNFDNQVEVDMYGVGYEDGDRAFAKIVISKSGNTYSYSQYVKDLDTIYDHINIDSGNTLEIINSGMRDIKLSTDGYIFVGDNDTNKVNIDAGAGPVYISSYQDDIQLKAVDSGDIKLLVENESEAIVLSVGGTELTLNKAKIQELNNLKNSAPIGEIIIWGGGTNNIPSGFLLCDGRSTSGYTELAAIVGSNVPDLRDRFVLGGGGNKTLNTTCGSETVTLTAAQSGLPSHTHTTEGSADDNGEEDGTYPLVGRYLGGGNYIVSQNTAQNAQEAHNNMPPYYVLSYIIRATN